MTPALSAFIAPSAALAAGVAALLFDGGKRGGKALALFFCVFTAAAAAFCAAYGTYGSGEAWEYSALSAFCDISVAVLALLCLPLAAGGDALSSTGFTLLAGTGVMCAARGSNPAFLVTAQALAMFALTALFSGGRERLRAQAAVSWIFPAVFALALSLFGFSLMRHGGGLYGAGITLLCAGGFCLCGLFPFGLALPEVFGGAGAARCAFYAAAVMPLSAIALVFPLSLSGDAAAVRAAVAALGAVSATLASLAALREPRPARVVALAVCASAGWIVCAAAGAESARAAVALAVAHAAAAGGLCAALALVSGDDSGGGSPENMEVFSGLWRLSPGAAFALAAVLFSNAGAPFTAGFAARFYSLVSMVRAGTNPLICSALALDAVLAAALAARFLRPAFFGEPQADKSIPSGGAASMVLAVCALATILPGIVPQLLLYAAGLAARN